MSLSKSKCLYSNNCLQFLKRAVQLPDRWQLTEDKTSYDLLCLSLQKYLVDIWPFNLEQKQNQKMNIL